MRVFKEVLAIFSVSCFTIVFTAKFYGWIYKQDAEKTEPKVQTDRGKESIKIIKDEGPIDWKKKGWS